MYNIESMGTVFFFFNDTATTEIYTLSLHDALPIFNGESIYQTADDAFLMGDIGVGAANDGPTTLFGQRSEEHTSELQSRQYLVCRLLLEKKKKLTNNRLKLYISVHDYNDIDIIE